MFSYPDRDTSGRIYSASEGQGTVRGYDLGRGLGQNNSDQGQNNNSRGQGQRYQGSKAWWSVGEFLHQGLTHRSVGLSLGHTEEETWDLSDSLADLYQAVTQRQYEEATRHKRHNRRGSGEGGGRMDGDRSVDKKKWLDEDTSHGFIRVYTSDNETSFRLFPCTLSTPAQKICLQLGVPGNSLHVQLNGDVIRRMEPFDCPLAIQNEYLADLGYEDVKYIQQEGLKEDLAFMVRFYAGKPLSDSTYSRCQLQAYAYVRKGKLLHQWVRRWCVISGTRLLIHRDKGAQPTVLQLAKGSVEEVQVKGQSLVLKLTSTYQGEKSIYLSFVTPEDYNKWLRKIRKATVKLPSKADLSNCHLEFIPENVFMNNDLQILILRHNVLRERPIDEDIYTIGWLDDLPTFTALRSLNLADNQLMTFPFSLCSLHSLMELNLASNKLEELPPEISKLVSLQVLHLHNNKLSALPEEMAQMRSLTVVVLAFNRFVNIPAVLLQSQHASFRLDSIIMAGNEISRLPVDHLSHMGHIKKIDLRLNKLQLLPTETAKFQSLEHITHVDIRENHVADLDIRAIRCLEYLNCDRNNIKSLQINGASLKNVFASHNCLQTLAVSPKPEWLVSLNISHNQLTELPSWLADCLFLVQLDVRHNQLTTLPDRLFTDAKRLKIVKANHNCLTSLPDKIRTDTLEELHLQHNFIRQLSVELFIKAHRLRYLNMTRNKLCDLPPPNKNDSYNKLQELYLSFNLLNNRCLHKICCFPRLRVLHLAKNKLSAIEETDIEKLEQLMELNVSSNNLTYLPAVLGRHPKLQVLRANCNLLQELPNFKNSSGIKVLEVSSNHLVNVNMSNLMASQMSLLDISANPNILVKSHDIDVARNPKKLCMIDMRGQNLSLEDVRGQAEQDEGQLWQTGLSQTSGIRNKLSVTAINKPHFSDKGDALFAIFDGGRNEAVASILCDIMPAVLREERARNKNPYIYLKLCFLSAHRNLKTQGQKLGAAATVAHVYKDDRAQYTLAVANVGDVQVVICRQKRAYLLTRKFVTCEDVEDNKRVLQSGGIITEDGRVSGVTYNTRLLGCSYLFPHVIPDPHITSITLTSEDTFFILASHGLWHYITYDEAIKEIMDIPDPVVAAKRLQDLAQGYGSRENISVLVVRLMLTEEERSRIKDLMIVQRSTQKELLKILNCQDDLLHLRDGVPKVEELDGVVINKSGHARKHYVSRKHLLDNRSVSRSGGSLLPAEVPGKVTAAPDTSSQKMEKNVLFQEEVSLEGKSHKKLRKEKSDGTSDISTESYLSQKKKHLSVHSSSESSLRRLAGYTGNKGMLQILNEGDDFDDNMYNENSKERGELSPAMVPSKKIATEFYPRHTEDEQMSTQEKASEDDEDIFISAEESLSDIIHVTGHSPQPHMSAPGSDGDNSDKQSDFYYRMSPSDDFNVSPSESVSSIDVRVIHEDDEIYKLRYISSESQNKGHESKSHLSKTKMYTSALSETSQLNQNEFYTRPVSPESVISQDEFVKPPVSFANIDRDALFFHQMQMARAQTQTGSNTSLDSIQSAPMHASSKDSCSNIQTSSHSIEVLLNLADNRSFKRLSDSLTGGRVVMGSSLVGNQPGTSTATNSRNANVDSLSESNSYSLENFQKIVEADVYALTTSDRKMGCDNSCDDGDMNDSDNDTLVGDAQDLAQIGDFDFTDGKSSQSGDRTFYDGQTVSHMDRSLSGNNRSQDASSDSDSDESLGNISLEDGYSAIQFSRMDRLTSLSMNNVLDSEGEDYPEYHLAQKYIKNKAKSAQKGSHFVKIKSGSFQNRTLTASKYQDENNHYETIDVLENHESNSKNINEFVDDANPYEDIDRSPPKERTQTSAATTSFLTQTSAAHTSLLRQASVSSEEDIDVFYAKVHKIKRDKLREKIDSPQIMSGHLQTFLPMFVSESGQNRDQAAVAKNTSHQSLASVVERGRDEDIVNEEKEICITTSDMLPAPYSSSKSRPMPISSTPPTIFNRDYPQGAPSTFNRDYPQGAPSTFNRDYPQGAPSTFNRDYPQRTPSTFNRDYPQGAPSTFNRDYPQGAPSTFNRDYQQVKQFTNSPGVLKRPPTQSSFGSHSLAPSSSAVLPKKLSPPPLHKCNIPDIDVDRPVSLSRSPPQSSDQTLSKSFKASATDLGAATASHFYPNPAQQPPTLTPNMPYPRAYDLRSSTSSARPNIPPKPSAVRTFASAQHPSSGKSLPTPVMESFKPIFRQSPTLVKSEIRSHEPSQSVLSAHELYPDTYQPSLLHSPSVDIKEAASKLSSQRSINITYL